MNRVKLVAATVPVIEDAPEIDSAEDFIAYAARVSNPKNQDNPNTQRLVKYLIRERHWSPFEMVNVCMEINTTRDIARQILRHRSFSFQEFSQRYASVEELDEMFTTRETRLQDTNNRQNSTEIDSKNIDHARVSGRFQGIQIRVIDLIRESYKDLLELGVAKEQARAILPEGLTKSRLYMSGSLRSWIHYCDLRMGNGTQKEHIEVARECWEILRGEFPNIIEACEDAQKD